MNNAHIDQAKLKLAHDAFKLFASDADALGANRANRASAIATALRPYLQYVHTGVVPKALHDNADKRFRQYRVSMVWTDVASAETIAESEGRRYDTERNLIELGGDVVSGLDTAAQLVAEYAAQLPVAPESLAEFTHAALARPFGNLRRSLSFKHGAATLNRVSKDNKLLLKCEVQTVKEV